MAEFIEYILRTSLGDSVFRRVEVSDAVDADGNDIRRVFVFYDGSKGSLDGSLMLDTSLKVRDHFRDQDNLFAEVSYLSDAEKTYKN